MHSDVIFFFCSELRGGLAAQEPTGDEGGSIIVVSRANNGGYLANFFGTLLA